MMWVELLAAVAIGLASQAEPPSDSLIPLIEKLSSSNVEERQAAHGSLRSKGMGALPTLRRSCETASDAEVAARLKQIIKEILIGRSSELSEAGKLEEALVVLAESEGAKDQKAYVQERLGTVRAEIRSWFPARDRVVSSLPDYKAIAARVMTNYGTWGLAVLMEELALRGNATPVPAADLLEALGKPALPHLCQALMSSNRTLQGRACTVLHQWSSKPGGPEVTGYWVEAAQKLAHDEKTEEWVREKAQEMLRFLQDPRNPGNAPKKK